MRHPSLILVAELVRSVHAGKSVRNSAGLSHIKLSYQLGNAVRSVVRRINTETLGKPSSLILAGKIVARIVFLQLYAINIVAINFIGRGVDYGRFRAMNQMKGSVRVYPKIATRGRITVSHSNLSRKMVNKVNAVVVQIIGDIIHFTPVYFYFWLFRNKLFQSKFATVTA